MEPSFGDIESAVILGASSDIGLELLARLDGRVPLLLLHAFKNGERLRQWARQARSKTVVCDADLSDFGQVDALAKSFEAYVPVPGAWVHLAAPRVRLARFKDHPPEDFETELKAQFHGPLRLLRRWTPKMASACRGRLLFLLTAPTVGRVPSGMAPYLSAKFALLGLMRSLAAEYGPKGVRVHALSPGMTRTGFLEHIHSSVVEQAAEASPLGRLCTPVEVADALAFLLSEQAAFFHGVNLPMDAGES
jgi:3-oxoacyl-[acyl-carrier protein] reductase